MLKLQYFSHLMQKKKKESTHWKRTWCWERLRAGGERDDIGWNGWMASPTQWIWVWADSGRQIVKDRGAWHAVVREVTKSQTQFNMTSLLVRVPSCVLPLWNWIVCFLRVCIKFESSLCIPNVSPSSAMWLANIFFQMWLALSFFTQGLSYIKSF